MPSEPPNQDADDPGFDDGDGGGGTGGVVVADLLAEFVIEVLVRAAQHGDVFIAIVRWDVIEAASRAFERSDDPVNRRSQSRSTAPTCGDQAIGE